jgi:Tol biopolymer transport system component
MRKLAGFFAVLAALTCTDHEPAGPTPPGPRAEISDGRHTSGNAHFFFLPPLVADPHAAGTFDPSLSPVVQICVLGTGGCVTPLVAEFTTTSGPGSETVRVNATDLHYIVNWRTDQFSLDPSKTYRIQVVVTGTLLGFADVDVVASAKEARNVQTGQFIPLVNGTTLPIKFRIEQGAFVPCPAPEIAFNQGEPSAGILAVDPAGCRVRLLIDDPDRWEADPAWSPDGQAVAYSGTGGDLGIPIVRADGAVGTLVYTGEPSSTPAWSPDGRRIAYAGPSGITLVDVDGSNKTPLNADGGDPAWSPDGSRIAFSSSRNGLPEIYVMDANGSHQTRLTANVSGDPIVYDVAPDWSPDGTRIALTRFIGVSPTIVVMDADGSNSVSLGPGGGPSWSPDGTMIAFSALNQIYVMGADGSNRRRITENFGFGYSPDWRSVAR